MIEIPVSSNLDQEQWVNRLNDEMATIEETLRELERQYDELSCRSTRVEVERMSLSHNTGARTTLTDGTPNIDKITFASCVGEAVEPKNPDQILQGVDRHIISLRQKKNALQALIASTDDHAKTDWLKTSVDRYLAELLKSYEHDHTIKREKRIAVEINTNQQALIVLAMYPQLCTSVESERKEKIIAAFLEETKRVLKTTDTKPALQMLNLARELGLIPSDPSLKYSQELALLGLLTKLDTDIELSTRSS